MLDSICRLLPAPGTRVYRDTEGNELAPDPDAPAVAQVWRTAVDPFLGQLSYVRVISGTLTTGTSVQNTSTDTKESISSMIYVVGKKQTPVTKAGPGDTVAIPKLKNTKTGNTLVAAGSTVRMPDLDLPQPVMFMAVEAKTQADEDKLSTAIHVADSDPP